MGFFSNMGAIQRINALLKTIETKVISIQKEAGSLHPSADKIHVDARTICVLMNEICEIAESHGESVGSISYFFLNRKTNLMEISNFLSDLVDRCDRI